MPLFILILLVLLIGGVFLLKNEVTYRRRKVINEAIFEYHMNLLKKDEYNWVAVDWFDMEPYESTLYRIWDWGYTRILPPEKYEIIKPYIAKVKGGKK